MDRIRSAREVRSISRKRVVGPRSGGRDYKSVKLRKQWLWQMDCMMIMKMRLRLTTCSRRCLRCKMRRT